jgi:molybdopterin synthase sulfur carrier subunit
MALVFIPSLLRRLTNGQERVTVPGATLRQIINNLDQAYPGMRDELLAEGEIKPGIAVAIDGETNHLGLLERVREDSEVHFIPAIGGG